MQSYKDLKTRLLKNPAIRRDFDALAPEFAVAQLVIETRLAKGWTQAQLAQKIGTRQSAIARLESGTYNPSVRFLAKVAHALNGRLVVSLL